MLLHEFERMMRNQGKRKALTSLSLSVSIIALGILVILSPLNSLNLIMAALCGGLIGSVIERSVFFRIFELLTKSHFRSDYD